MIPDFEQALIDFLTRKDPRQWGLANDFAPPRPPGPERVLNAVSIEQDMEKILGPGALERMAARARAERRLWFDPPEIKVEPPPFRLSLAFPAPAYCRINFTGVA